MCSAVHVTEIIPCAFRDTGTGQIVGHKDFTHVNLAYGHYGKVGW